MGIERKPAKVSEAIRTNNTELIQEYARRGGESAARSKAEEKAEEARAEQVGRDIDTYYSDREKFELAVRELASREINEQ